MPRKTLVTPLNIFCPGQHTTSPTSKFQDQLTFHLSRRPGVQLASEIGRACYGLLRTATCRRRVICSPIFFLLALFLTHHPQKKDNWIRAWTRWTLTYTMDTLDIHTFLKEQVRIGRKEQIFSHPGFCSTKKIKTVHPNLNIETKFTTCKVTEKQCTVLLNG